MHRAGRRLGRDGTRALCTARGARRARVTVRTRAFLTRLCCFCLRRSPPACACACASSLAGVGGRRASAPGALAAPQFRWYAAARECNARLCAPSATARRGAPPRLRLRMTSRRAPCSTRAQCCRCRGAGATAERYLGCTCARQETTRSQLMLRWPKMSSGRPRPPRCAFARCEETVRRRPPPSFNSGQRGSSTRPPVTLHPARTLVSTHNTMRRGWSLCSTSRVCRQAIAFRSLSVRVLSSHIYCIYIVYLFRSLSVRASKPEILNQKP